MQVGRYKARYCDWRHVCKDVVGLKDAGHMPELRHRLGWLQTGCLAYHLSRFESALPPIAAEMELFETLAAAAMSRYDIALNNQAHRKIDMEIPDIKTPETHPDHPVVGHYFAGPHFGRDRTEIYFCDSYDPRVDYYMTNANDPAERRAVSVRAIGRTWMEAEDRDTHWFVPIWGLRIEKSTLALP